MWKTSINVLQQPFVAMDCLPALHPVCNIVDPLGPVGSVDPVDPVDPY